MFLGVHENGADVVVVVSYSCLLFLFPPHFPNLQINSPALTPSGDPDDTEFVPRSDAAANAAAEAAAIEGDDGEINYVGPSAAGFSRSDCFKVEKHLLIYGWGRWQEIKLHSR